jgi:hypothetical protein
MNLSTADLRNYWTKFHDTWWSYRYMFRYRTLLNFYCPFFMPCFGSHFENDRHLENLKRQNGSSNGDLSLCQKFLPVDIFKMAATIPHKFNIVRFQRPELIPDIEKFLPVSIFKMAATIPQKFNIVRFQR